MASFKDQAIVLRRLDYSESSQVLAFFTRVHGQRRLIAKGIKRGTKQRFATGIDLLEQGELVFWQRASSESGLGTLTEWRQTQLFLGLRESLDRWYAALYTAEITTGMTQEADAHPPLYDALANTLRALSSGSPPVQQLVGYQRAALTEAGLWPEFTRCVNCSRAAPPGRAGYYSPRQGGIVCRDCAVHVAEKRLVSAAVLNELRDPSEPASPAAFELLDYTIGYALGRRVELASQVLAALRGRAAMR